MFKRLLVFVLLAAFLLPFGSAVISSQRAMDFVTKENYFLYENESGQVFPTVKIKHAKDYYWLVAVSSGEAPGAYVPVLDKKEISVPDNTAVQRALFKTADVIWFVSKFKERVSSQDQWFFSTSNSSFFSNLSLVLKNEPFELESIKTDLKDSKANAEIASMNSSIILMSQDSQDLATKINNAISVEQAFFNDPDTASLDNLRAAYDDAFSLATGISGEIIAYNASVTKIKKIISESSIDAGKKNQLLSFANPPQELLQVSGKVVIANSVKQAIDSAFNSSLSRSKDLVDNIALRLKRNKAAFALKITDADFKEKTKGKFDSLEQAAAAILSSDYYSFWKNQEKASEFSENYSRAKSLFEKGDYDLSISFSAKAKSNAIIVLQDGFQETEPQGIDWTIWIYVAAVIVVLFAIIYFLRNRRKLSSLIQQQGSSEEEVKIHGWERRP